MLHFFFFFRNKNETHFFLKGVKGNAGSSWYILKPNPHPVLSSAKVISFELTSFSRNLSRLRNKTETYYPVYILLLLMEKMPPLESGGNFNISNTGRFLRVMNYCSKIHFEKPVFFAFYSRTVLTFRRVIVDEILFLASYDFLPVDEMPAIKILMWDFFLFLVSNCFKLQKSDAILHICIPVQWLKQLSRLLEVIIIHWTLWPAALCTNIYKLTIYTVCTIL